MFEELMSSSMIKNKNCTVAVPFQNLVNNKIVPELF